jgi:DNA-binding NarL/FixJ family response regulator
LLTPREKEILAFLEDGLRYKEIATRLFLSVETVRTHIRNIYLKLQVQSRTEALNKIRKTRFLGIF